MALYGYARVSSEGQTPDAQIAQLKAAGAEKVFREKGSGARGDRVQLRPLLLRCVSGPAGRAVPAS
jgi:DNA invertase Pin-like site-specific DNA recombinase